MIKKSLLFLLMAAFIGTIVYFFIGQSLTDQHVGQTESTVFQDIKALGYEDVFVREQNNELIVRFELEQLGDNLIDQMIIVAIKAAETETKSDQIMVQSYFLHEPFLALKTSQAKILEYAADQISVKELYNHIELEDLRSVNNKLSTDLSIFNFSLDHVELNQEKAELNLIYHQPALSTDSETVFWNDYLAIITIVLKDCPWVDEIVTHIELLSKDEKITISANSQDIISFLEETVSPEQFATLLEISDSQVTNAEETYQELLSNYYQALKDGDYQQASSYLSSNLAGYWDDYTGDAVATSYDILTAQEETPQKVIVFIEELLVGYDDSTALNYLNYTLIKRDGSWVIDSIQEVEGNAQINQSQISPDAAISAVGNFLNLLKQNKPQEAEFYVTAEFVKSETPGLFTEYSLFKELEVIETEADSNSISVKVKETWASGISMAEYKVISTEKGIEISSRELIE